MRKGLVIVAILALVAVPALAEKTAIPIDSRNVTVTPASQGMQRGSDDNVVYDNIWMSDDPSTFSLPSTPSTELGDDLHVTGLTMTHLHYWYVDPGAGQSHYVWLYSNNSDDTTMSFITGFSISGLPGGSNIIGINLSEPLVLPGTDIWMSIQPVDSTIDLVGGGNPGIGTSHDLLFTYNYFTGVTSYLAGSGNLNFAIAPEPTTIALFALGGLALLRRR